MPTAQYTALANVTLGSTASTVTFSSINQTYRDLLLVTTAIGSVSTNLNGRLNNDTGSAYHFVSAGGNGSTTLSQSGGPGTAFLWNDRSLLTTTTPLTTIINFMDYSVTDKHKTVLVRSGNSANGVSMLVNRWESTSAITTILIYPGSGSFAIGSSFALYGVK